MRKSTLEELLAFQIHAYALPEPEREYQFCNGRRWRFDFAWPDYKVAAEVEGGIWTGGRHVRGKGFEADCEKYNMAALLGWQVFRFTGNMVDHARAVQTLAEVLPFQGRS